MKLMKFGKALLMSALSAGIILSITSCAQSYSVGYLYVTGTDDSDVTGTGYITAFKIDHNTGKLNTINGMPISSGGANPVRAILTSNSRFIYVLNRGVSSNPAGSSICTADYPCQNWNITQFAVGGNGILTAQQTFYNPTWGSNPFRITADSTGSHSVVLFHDSPTSPSDSNCGSALGGSLTTCGDIAAFSVDSSTGRLSLVTNAALSTLYVTVPYFPVPANPVDFVYGSPYVLTLSSATAQTTYPYTGGSIVYPLTYNASGGPGISLLSTNSTQTITDNSIPGSITIKGVANGTAIVLGGTYVYILDNNPIYLNGSTTASSQSQILPYTIGTNGALNTVNSGSIADDANQSNPIYLTQESKGKWFYVANQGYLSNHLAVSTGLTGYIINTLYSPSELTNAPGTGTGSGPQCMVEDPSNQFFYEANAYDKTVTGQSLDENGGELVPLTQSTHAPSSYALSGPATWCLIDGRTN